MSKNKLIGVALAGLLGTGLAQAGGDVQWSVTIGLPGPFGWLRYVANQESRTRSTGEVAPVV